MSLTLTCILHFHVNGVGKATENHHRPSDKDSIKVPCVAYVYENSTWISQLHSLLPIMVRGALEILFLWLPAPSVVGWPTWRFRGWNLKEGEDLSREQCHWIHLSRQPFSLELISIIWRSRVTAGDIQVPPWGWQAYSMAINMLMVIDSNRTGAAVSTIWLWDVVQSVRSSGSNSWEGIHKASRVQVLSVGWFAY